MNHKISIKTKDSLLSLDELKAQGVSRDDIVGITLQTEAIGMIISLDEWSAIWYDGAECKVFNQTCNESEALQTLNGLELTHTIAMQSGNNTAAVVCWNYNKDGLQWYLPCIYELSTIAAYREEINEILGTIGAIQLNKDKLYWSSSKNGQFTAWYVYFGSGGISYSSTSECGGGLVRAVAAFEPLVGSNNEPLDKRENEKPSYELTEEIAIQYLRDHGYTGKITKEINIK